MKKQINPTIKAHLIRSAFYLLLLIAVCAIPFALAQRNATKRSAAKPNSVLTPTATGSHAARLAGPLQQSSRVTSGPTGGSSVRALRMPVYPQVVLYDQYDNDLNDGIVSANRTDNPPLSAEAADNFVIPGGETWTITEVDIRSPAGFGVPTSFDVHFYTDSAGLPGTEVYVATGLAVTGNPDYVITLTSPAVLSSGTYWVSAVGTITASNWYWEGRSITNNTFSTAWRNPGGGYGTPCTDWGRLTTCIGINWPDQMFRIVGTTGGGGGCTTYTTTTGTGPIVPGDTDTGSHCDDCTVPITFPFPLSFYGNSYTDANISSNGNLQFTETIGYLAHGCNPLPVSFVTGPVIFGYWDDLMTNTGLTNCTTWANGCGVFTATTGTAPNRTFYIEWHAVHYFDGPAADFEMVFYENNPNLFDIIYGATSDNGSDETSGVQASATGPATTFSCGDSTLTDGLDVTYTCAGGGQSPTPTPTPTASPTGCQFHVLIVYADTGLPTQLQTEILAEPNVVACDLFDATTGTPTLGQLQQYEIVVPYSNFPFLDADTLGNNLADYVDGGGVVVQHGFSHYGPGQPYGINGRWFSGGYNPYDYSTNLEFNAFSLGTFNGGHPLMAGVTTLNSNFANIVTPNAGETEVAANNLGESLVAYRPVGGHTLWV